MHKTRSSKGISKSVKGHHKSKRRPNRKQSRSLGRGDTNHQHPKGSASIDQVLNYDKSFDKFNIPRYEGHYDKISRRPPPPPSTSPRVEASEPSLQFLKSPNNNTQEIKYCTCESATASDAETENMHVEPFQRQNERNQAQKDTPTLQNYVTEESDVTDVSRAKEEVPQTQSSEPMISLQELEALFTNQYKQEAVRINNSNFTNMDKMQKLNGLYRSWIVDLYEQIDGMSFAFDEISEAAQNDNKNYLEQIQSLESQLSTQLKWKDKCSTLNEEVTACAKFIRKIQEEKAVLTIQLVDSERNSEELRENIKALSSLVMRLRDSGEWNPKGLNLPGPIYHSIFKGHEHLIDKQIMNPEKNHSGGDQEEFIKEGERLQESLEQLRKNIFFKERRFQKLNIEEQSIKARIKLAQGEETELRSRITQLQHKEDEIQGIVDTSDKELNDFWRKI